MPAAVSKIVAHWELAGVWEESVSGFTVSDMVEPPHIITVAAYPFAGLKGRRTALAENGELEN